MKLHVDVCVIDTCGLEQNSKERFAERIGDTL